MGANGDAETGVDAGAGGRGVNAMLLLDGVMLAALPFLGAASAFFSASETTLFGLASADRAVLRRDRPELAARVDGLLAQPRPLLVTILLGNLTANSLFFSITSTLLMRAQLGLLWSAGLAVAALVLLVIASEVLPKLLANASRIRLVAPVTRLLLPLHLLLRPLHLVLDRGVIAPLARLLGGGRESGLRLEEIGDVLQSPVAATVDPRVRDLLQRVARLGRVRVRDIMTPRVDLVAVPRNAPRRAVEVAARRASLTRLVVYEDGPDDVAGFLDVRGFLLDSRGDATPVSAYLHPALVVPAVASVQQLLELFRREGRQLALVVDEFGGTEGVVALEDGLEEIVGDIAARDETAVPEPERLRDGRWRVSGELPAASLAGHFGVPLPGSAPSTAGGLVLELLGREPHRGDRAAWEGLSIEVDAVSRGRVRWLLVHERPEARS